MSIFTSVGATRSQGIIRVVVVLVVVIVVVATIGTGLYHPPNTYVAPFNIYSRLTDISSASRLLNT